VNPKEALGLVAEIRSLLAGARADCARAAGLWSAESSLHASWALIRLGRIAEVYPEAEAGLGAYRSLGDLKGAAHCLVAIGVARGEDGLNDEAVRACSEAAEIFAGIGDKAGQARAINASGIAYRRMGESAKAIEAYGASLALARGAGDRMGVGRALSNIGYIYMYEKNYVRAIEYTREALAVAREDGNLSSELSSCCNLVMSMVADGRAQEAVDFMSGYDMGKLSTSGLFQFLELTDGLSKAYVKVGRFADAESLLELGLGRARRDSNLRELSSLLCSYAALNRAHPEAGGPARAARLAAARKALDEALAIARTRDDDFAQGIHEEYCALCRDEGRWDEAFAHIDEAHRIAIRLSSASAEQHLARQRSEQEAESQKARADTEARQREIERKILQSQKTESLGVLAGGVVHHFNNLLTSILGNAQLARINPEFVADGLAEIEVSGRRAADLCKQIMMYTGRSDPQMEPVDALTLAQESVRLLRLTLVTDCEITCEAPAAPACAWGDHAQLQQILLNLLTNAIEAHATRISVRASVVRSDPPSRVVAESLGAGDFVELSVSDNGEGMAPEVIGRIFEPFFTTRFTGRGLGLPAAMGLVRAHQGTLTIESRPGAGTTARTFIPTGASRTTEPAKTPKEAPAGGTRVALVVEDEEAVRRVIVKFMARLGWKTMEAADGEEAVRTYKACQGRIDLLVSDYLMPKVNGLDAALQMRRMDPKLPVILMSGFTKEETAEKFRAGGFDNFLKKPFQLEDLRRILKVRGEPEAAAHS
jgi:signal transduction histidine kinase/CheY-like chemotaxis protein